MHDGAQPLSYGAFLRGLIRNPKGVSAPAPSSPVLAEAIAAELDPSRPGLVVELGPGTGAVTAALERRVGRERILAIEREQSFIAPLETRFPGLDVRRGDALVFDCFLPPHARVAALVSGLPLLHFPQAARRALLERALACQGAGGLFIQLSYSWRPPVTAGQGVTLTKRAILRNFPPAHVWTYRSEIGSAAECS
ncbi:MAG TPA: methyltransferase domain-containing protein [Rhizomicrobium sp.]|nr:methyltransferase domain-containing protein [Rhizomicrobium sp.]